MQKKYWIISICRYNIKFDSILKYAYNIHCDNNKCVLSDVSGGTSYSILNEMRSVLQVSNSLSMMKDNYTQLSYKDVFHMATSGGAKGTFFIIAY